MKDLEKENEKEGKEKAPAYKADGGRQAEESCGLPAMKAKAVAKERREEEEEDFTLPTTSLHTTRARHRPSLLAHNAIPRTSTCCSGQGQVWRIDGQ